MSGTEIAVSMLVVALAGCSNITNNDFDGLVEVVADIEPGGEGAVVTIRNESGETILLRQVCGGVGLDYRDGGEWQGNAMNCTANLGGSLPIEPGDELVSERSFGLYFTESGETLMVGDPPQLPPGEYRFQAMLTDAEENLLPEHVRTSNTFRIEP